MSRASNAASPGLSDARDDAPLEKFQNLHAGGMRRRDGLVIGGMRPDEMIDRRTGGGLAAFVEPEPGNHSRIIGTPDARDEARLGRRRHDAGRGSHDVGKAAAHIDRLARLRAPADRADASGVGVDQRRADRRSLEQAEIARGRFRQAGAQRRAGCDDLVSDFRVIVRGKIAKTDALEIAAAPALFVGEIIPFAGERAHRTRRRSGGAKRKIVGEIEEMTGRAIGRRQVPLQPKQFWNFHFRRDRAADIAKHVVLRLVDLAGFGDRAMIHPDDDIAPVVAGRC